MCHSHFFFISLLTFGILFSTAVNAKVVAKPLILGIPVLTSIIFVLRIVLVAKIVMSGILSSIFFIVALYSVFLTALFLLHYLVYLNQYEQVLIYDYLI